MYVRTKYVYRYIYINSSKPLCEGVAPRAFSLSTFQEAGKAQAPLLPPLIFTLQALNTHTPGRNPKTPKAPRTNREV